MSLVQSQYRDFCREGPVPLSHQPWWLDAVCGGEAHWGVALAEKRGLTGALPYFRTRRWGLPVIQLPPLTTYGGPLLQWPGKPVAKPHERRRLEQQVLHDLIEQLPRTAFFTQNFRPDIQDWLPFYWAGFRQTLRYTYRLPDTSDLPGLYAGLKNTVRTDLKTAARNTEVVLENEAELLFRLNRQSFRRKGLRQPYDFAAFSRLHAALQARGQAQGFGARDRHTGAPHAGLYLVFDTRQAAVLLAGFDPGLGSASCALHGLYWEAIRFCSERGLSLDFEGSMDPGIGRVFRAFGGQLTPYFQVWKAGYRVLDVADRLFR